MVSAAENLKEVKKLIRKQKEIMKAHGLEFKKIDPAVSFETHIKRIQKKAREILRRNRHAIAKT